MSYRRIGNSQSQDGEERPNSLDVQVDCLSIFVTHEDPISRSMPYRDGVSPTGQTADGGKLQKIEPREIHHLNKGESISAVVPTRPATAFDSFALRTLMVIGRPLCLPLMLVTLDFSGARYMNARIAYQMAQRNFRQEQAHVVIPLASRIWRWWFQCVIRAGKLRERRDASANEVVCQR